MINKQELKYIAFATIFGFILFGLIIPNFLSKINGLNPYVQFAIFNVGIFIFLQIFLKAKALGSKVNIIGSIGLIIFVLALDILLPPYSVSFQGALLTGATLSPSASDYVAGMAWGSIGIHGFILYLFTYLITPMVLFLIAAQLMPNFVKEL